MSYTAYAIRMKNSLSSLANTNNSLESADLDSTWEGSARNKQIKHRDDLSTSLTDSLDDLSSLSQILELIDDYDNTKKELINQEDIRNNAEKGSSELELANININSLNTKLSSQKSNINNLLNSINTRYTEKLEIIPTTKVQPTNDIFIKTFSSSNNISKAFELSQYAKNLKNYSSNPNFNNTEAWVTKNPYSQAGLYGQCTWFAWGKFYEMYGYSPGFTGNGNQCVRQLLANHSDKFKLSSTPVTGSVFSYKGYPYGHVGIITEVKDGMLTYQDGNYDNVTNSFAVAKTDWRTNTISVQSFINKYGGNVEFANPV